LAKRDDKDDLDLFGGSSEEEHTQGQFGGFGNNNASGNGFGGFGNLDVNDVGDEKPVNKKAIVAGILAGVLVIGGGTGGYMYWNKQHKEHLAVEKAKNLEKQRVNVLKSLEDAIPNFTTKELLPEGDEVISNLDMEIVYMNENKTRTEFLKKVLEKAEVNASKSGIEYTHINWSYVSALMQNVDYEKIQKMYKDAGIDRKAHDFQDKMADLYSKYISENYDKMVAKEGDYARSYINSFAEPTITVSMSLNEATDKDGKVTMELLNTLDKSLFGSDEFHNSLDVFGLVATGDIGKKEETEKHKEWASRKKILEDYGSKIDKLPVNELKDVNNVLKDVLNDNYKVNIDDPKDAYKKALEELNKVEPVPWKIDSAKDLMEKFKKGSLTPYTWIGSYFLQNEYKDAEGKQIIVNAQIGDGSYEKPKAIGSSFVTKAKGTDGKYHDVKVTLKSITTGQDAIKQSLEVDERNQGFTTTSDLVLGVVMFTVENTTDDEIEIDSEFSLADKSINLVPRNGSMFGFKERIKLKGREIGQMSDWFFAKEVDTSNLIWGKTFNRAYPVVWQNVLADTVYDKYGRPRDRKERAIVGNKAQDNVNDLEQKAELKKKQKDDD